MEWREDIPVEVEANAKLLASELAALLQGEAVAAAIGALEDVGGVGNDVGLAEDVVGLVAVESEGDVLGLPGGDLAVDGVDVFGDLDIRDLDRGSGGQGGEEGESGGGRELHVESWFGVAWL